MILLKKSVSEKSKIFFDFSETGFFADSETWKWAAQDADIEDI